MEATVTLQGLGHSHWSCIQRQYLTAILLARPWISIYLSIYLSRYISIYLYIYIYIYTYIFIFIYTYTYTYIHIYIIIIQYLYSAISIAIFNSFITINILYDQRHFTISFSSTHLTPGEDIHHAVISCVGNWRLLPQPCRRRGLRFYVLSEKTKQCEWSVLLKDTTSCPSQDLNPGRRTQSPAHWPLDYSRLTWYIYIYIYIYIYLFKGINISALAFEKKLVHCTDSFHWINGRQLLYEGNLK